MENATAGDIVAITGITGSKAGENYLLSESINKYQNYLLTGFEFREPVYNASLEFLKNTDWDWFLKIIDEYLLEDPSLTFKVDKQTG